MYSVGPHQESVAIETSINQLEATNLRDVRDNLNSEVSSKYQAREHLGAQMTVGSETHSRFETFESFRYTNNQLISFYPKQIQKVLARRHKTNNPTSERLAQQIRLPNPKKAIKHAKKMQNLAICQANFMQVLLKKIDRRSKPIRREERVISNNLKKKRIFLEEENFDIMSILKQAAKI
jgi:hypothetical protein